MYLLDLQNRQTEMKTLIGKEDWKQGIGNEQSEVKNSAKRELFIFFVLLVNQDKPLQCNTPINSKLQRPTPGNPRTLPRAIYGHMFVVCAPWKGIWTSSVKSLQQN